MSGTYLPNCEHSTIRLPHEYRHVAVVFQVHAGRDGAATVAKRRGSIGIHRETGGTPSHGGIRWTLRAVGVRRANFSRNAPPATPTSPVACTALPQPRSHAAASAAVFTARGSAFASWIGSQATTQLLPGR